MDDVGSCRHAPTFSTLSINHINNKTKLWFLQQQQNNNCKEEHFLLLGLFFRQIGTWYDKWLDTRHTTPSFLSLLLRFSSVLKLLSLNSSSCIIKCTLNHYDKWLCLFKLLLPNWVPLLKVQNSTIFCWIESQKRIRLPALCKRDVVNLQRDFYSDDRSTWLPARSKNINSWLW